MKNVFRTALCAAVMTAAVCVPTFAVKADAPVPAKQGDFYVLANDQYVTFTDAVPQIRDSRSYLPMATVFDQLGFKDIQWNDAQRSVTASKDGVTVKLVIGSPSIALTKDGKTTTIAKLAHRARMQGKKVMIAAADTFRAAAIEQLQVWAERVGALFHARPAGSDPASVAYEAMDRALAEKVDILFVDTAGRLQTKVNLMEELTKIRQVLGKKHEGAPHRCILVIDATTGQNALSQAKLFKEAAGVDELILTKLDGTAKGGVAIAVAMQEKLPITYVGLGEKLEDLRPFNGADYARALLGDLDQGK